MLLGTTTPTHMKIPSNKTHAFTLIELLVVVSIIGILISIAVPNIIGAINKTHLTESLVNARSLRDATMAMTMDTQQIGDGLRWTFVEKDGKSTPASLAQFLSALTEGGYLEDSMMCKLLRAPGRNPTRGNYTADNIAFKIYEVSDTSPSDQIFITSANINPPSGGMGAETDPFGNTGFVYLSKAGDCGIRTRPADATSSTIFPTGDNYKYIALQ